jgi:alanine transaminase
MYAFPSIRFSEKVKQKAAEAGMQPDTYYCMEVLKNTGIVLVPGNGFKQKKDTYHFRITTLILPLEHL